MKTDEGLRRALLRFIADFANWDDAAKADYLETGRALVRAAHPEETDGAGRGEVRRLSGWGRARPAGGGDGLRSAGMLL